MTGPSRPPPIPRSPRCPRSPALPAPPAGPARRGGRGPDRGRARRARAPARGERASEGGPPPGAELRPRRWSDAGDARPRAGRGGRRRRGGGDAGRGVVHPRVAARGLRGARARDGVGAGRACTASGARRSPAGSTRSGRPARTSVRRDRRTSPAPARRPRPAPAAADPADHRGTYPYLHGRRDVVVRPARQRSLIEFDWQVLPIVAPHGRPPLYELPRARPRGRPHRGVVRDAAARAAAPERAARRASRCPALLVRGLIGWNGDTGALLEALTWCRRHPAGVRRVFRSRRGWERSCEALRRCSPSASPEAGTPPAARPRGGGAALPDAVLGGAHGRGRRRPRPTCCT